MDKLDDLLRYIQRTNPEMTKEKLITELCKSSEYSVIAFDFCLKNFSPRDFDTPLYS